MPQFGAPQSGQLQAMLSAFVQNKQRNDLSLLNLAKKKQDESSIAAIANAYRTKLSSASEDELPSIMGQSLQALSPYSDNPATQYVAKGLEAELQARKAQTQREKENKLINILRSGKEEPLPQVMGGLMSAKRPLNENEILSEVEQSGLVGGKDIAEIELKRAKMRSDERKLIEGKPTESDVWVDEKGQYVPAGTPNAKPYQTKTGSTTEKWTGRFVGGRIVPATLKSKIATTDKESPVEKDLEDYRAKYNEANAAVSQLEDIYGKDNLMNWNQDAVVKQNVATYGDDAASILAAINEGKLSPEEAQKIKAVTVYTKAVSSKKGQEKNLLGKGYYVDDSGKLIQGKKPDTKVEAPKPKGKTKVLTDVQGNKIEVEIEE